MPADRRPLVVALGVVVAVQVVAGLVSGSGFAPLPLLLPPLVAVLVNRCAVGTGLPPLAAAGAAVLATASPLAVAAAQSPGAGFLALGAGAALGAAASAGGGRAGRPAPSGRRGWAPGARGNLVLALLAAAAPGALVVSGRAASGAGRGSDGWADGWARGWGSGAARLDPGAAALATWVHLDPVVPVLAALASVGLLLVPGRRPLGAAVLVVVAAVVAGDLRPVVLVGALGLVAVAVATAAAVALDRVPTGRRAVLGAGLAAAAVVPALVVGLPRLPDASASSPAAAAGRWVTHQVPPGEPVAVDAGLYDLLADDGAATRALVAVPVPASRAARVRWLVSTPRLRAAASPGGWVARALGASRTVTAFGGAGSRIEVRELTAPVTATPGATAPPSAGTSSSPFTAAAPAPSPSTAQSPATAPPTTSTRAASPAAAQLAANAHLTLTAPARAELTTAAVDDRLVTLLAQVVASTPLSVADLPVTAGDAKDAPRRAALVSSIGGQDVAHASAALDSLQVLLSAQAPSFRPTTQVTGTGDDQQLLITLPATSG